MIINRRMSLLIVLAVTAVAVLFVTQESSEPKFGNPLLFEGASFTKVTLSKEGETRLIQVPNTFQIPKNDEPVTSIELFLTFPEFQAVGANYVNGHRPHVRIFITIASKKAGGESLVERALDSASAVPAGSGAEYFVELKNGFDIYQSNNLRPFPYVDKKYTFKDQDNNIVVISEPIKPITRYTADKRLDNNLNLIYQFPGFVAPSDFREIDTHVSNIVKSFIPEQTTPAIYNR